MGIGSIGQTLHLALPMLKSALSERFMGVLNLFPATFRALVTMQRALFSGGVTWKALNWRTCLWILS
jgi:hypothetical protein